MKFSSTCLSTISGRRWRRCRPGRVTFLKVAYFDRVFLWNSGEPTFLMYVRIDFLTWRFEAIVLTGTVSEGIDLALPNFFPTGPRGLIAKEPTRCSIWDCAGKNQVFLKGRIDMNNEKQYGVFYFWAEGWDLEEYRCAPRKAILRNEAGSVSRNAGVCSIIRARLYKMKNWCLEVNPLFLPSSK